MATRRSYSKPKADRNYPELAELADLLDSRWRIPGTGIRFGVDAIAGILPFVGGSATGLISAYIIYKAHSLGAPREMIVRMAANVGLDLVVGSIPVAGAVFDLFFKANNANVRLLRKHLESKNDRHSGPTIDIKATRTSAAA